MKFLLFILPIILIGCTLSTEKSKPLIITTTGIIKNSIQEIVNDHCDVESIDIISLLGPNSDPHMAKGSKQDLKKLFEADAIISNGLHLEGKLSEVLEKFNKNAKR